MSRADDGRVRAGAGVPPPEPPGAETAGAVLDVDDPAFVWPWDDGVLPPAVAGQPAPGAPAPPVSSGDEPEATREVPPPGEPAVLEPQERPAPAAAPAVVPATGKRRLPLPRLPRPKVLVPVVLVLALVGGGARFALAGGDATASAAAGAGHGGPAVEADPHAAPAQGDHAAAARVDGHAAPAKADDHGAPSKADGHGAPSKADGHAAPSKADDHGAAAQQHPAAVAAPPAQRAYDGTKHSTDPANRAGQPGWPRAYTIGRELVLKDVSCEQAAPLVVAAGLITPGERADYVKGCRART